MWVHYNNDLSIKQRIKYEFPYQLNVTFSFEHQPQQKCWPFIECLIDSLCLHNRNSRACNVGHLRFYDTLLFFQTVWIGTVCRQFLFIPVFRAHLDKMKPCYFNAKLLKSLWMSTLNSIHAQRVFKKFYVVPDS